MQRDDEIGKLASNAPVIMAKSAEKFIQFLTEAAAKVAQQESSKSITPKILLSAVQKEEVLDFLKSHEMFAHLKVN